MTKKIVIDPGHGGGDSGAVGFGLQEKNINLDLALRLRTMLSDYADVRLTRDSDIFVSLSERAAFANKLGADIFVSIHVNAGGGTGFESYIYTSAPSQTADIRETVHKEIASFYEASNFPDRGMKKADFAVLRQTLMPAILLENLFVDRQKDAAVLGEPAFRGQIAEAVSKGIIKVLNLTGTAPVTPPTTQPPQWAKENFARLKQAGIVYGEHNLSDQVTWGELSAVIARVLDKVKV